VTAEDQCYLPSSRICVKLTQLLSIYAVSNLQQQSGESRFAVCAVVAISSSVDLL
jgi:hypothetical protein